MAAHVAAVRWTLKEGEDFLAGRYSRVHRVAFDGGIEVEGAAATSVVPPPWSTEGAVDPEEMFVASLSACHMLWFLSLAAKAGVAVTAYDDAAEGVMARNAEGRVSMTRVTLRPRLIFAGEPPSSEAIERLHHQAHEACFIANSVRSEVRIEPRG